jgi:protein involved in polysaccharide export with SLBB domain
LNGSFRIGFDGFLILPYGVHVKAQGLSIEQLRSSVVEAYRAYLKSPETLHISLADKKIEVEVRGLVNKPGRHVLSPDAAIDEILAEAGGLLPNSQAEFARFQGSDGTSVLLNLTQYYDTGDVSMVPSVHGGDTIFFQRSAAMSGDMLEGSSPKIRIMGEVKTPGQFAYRASANMVDYMAMAGGPTAVADMDEIEVLHSDNGVITSQMYKWDQAKTIASLRENDTVLIHAVQQTWLERRLQSFTGIATILSAIGILIIAL